MSEPRKHVWISNTAFTRITGIKFVCMDCGAGVARKSDVPRECPGKKESR